MHFLRISLEPVTVLYSKLYLYAHPSQVPLQAENCLGIMLHSSLGQLILNSLIKYSVTFQEMKIVKPR
jgi:hypothetical protein